MAKDEVANVPWNEHELPAIGFRVRWRKIYAVLDFEVTDTAANGEPYANGMVRFDGCCNVMFNDCAEQTMIHGCGRAGMTRLGALFEALYDLAIEAMPEHRDLLT